MGGGRGWEARTRKTSGQGLLHVPLPLAATLWDIWEATFPWPWLLLLLYRGGTLQERSTALPSLASSARWPYLPITGLELVSLRLLFNEMLMGCIINTAAF